MWQSCRIHTYESPLGLTHLSTGTESHNRPKVLQNTAVQYGETGQWQQQRRKPRPRRQLRRRKPQRRSRQQRRRSKLRFLRCSTLTLSGRSIGHPQSGARIALRAGEIRSTPPFAPPTAQFRSHLSQLAILYHAIGWPRYRVAEASAICYCGRQNPGRNRPSNALLERRWPDCRNS